MENSK